MDQLLRLVAARHGSLLSSSERVVQCIGVLVAVVDTDLVSPLMNHRCIVGVHQMVMGFFSGLPRPALLHNLSAAIPPEQMPKLEQILSLDMKASVVSMHTPSSPLATAPIHDVLLKR